MEPNLTGSELTGTNPLGPDSLVTNHPGIESSGPDSLVSDSSKIKKKFIDRLKDLHENLSTSKQKFDEFGNEINTPPWGIGFAYYIIFVLALADVSIYVDLWVNNPNVILGVHVTRIVFLLSALTLAIISFAKGWRGTMIYTSTDIIVKLLSFGITLGYLISMAVKVHGNKSAGEIFRLVLSAILTIVSALFAIMAIKSKFFDGNDETPVVMYQIIILAIIAILLSVVSIVKRNSKDDKSTIPLSGLRK